MKNPKIRLPEKTLRVSKPHPSRGGSRGYDLAQRQAAMRVKDAGRENDPIFGDMRDDHIHPSIRTTNRLATRRTDLNSIEAFVQTGNVAFLALSGFHIFHLYHICQCSQNNIPHQLD